MERDQRPRMVYGKLPRDVEEELSALHIEKTWELLADKFCFNVKAWKQEFQAYRQRQSGNSSQQEAFVGFGSEFINPVLNTVLKRTRYHPTWSNLLKYIIKKY